MQAPFVCSPALDLSHVDFCWVAGYQLPGVGHPFCGGGGVVSLSLTEGFLFGV